MRKITILFFLMVGLTLTTRPVFGSHVNGGEITYKCIGTNQYVIDLTLYWECSNIAFPTTQTIDISSSTLGQNFSTNLLLVDSGEVSRPCPSASTVCSNLSAPFPGTFKYVFRDTIQLAGIASDWLVEYNNCCRLGSITNLINPSGQNIHLNTVIDNNIVCNSSPYFLTEPLITSFQGQFQCMSFKALDPDGDSLAYKVVNALNSFNGPISFNSGYSLTSPLESNAAANFSINSTTGEVCFLVNIIGLPNLTVEVEEYRNGQLIGKIRRDLVYFILNSANTAPVLSGVDTSYSFSKVDTTVCGGQLITLNMSAFDANALDAISIHWDSAISGGILNITYPTSNSAKFSLSFASPSKDTILSYTIFVYDSVCPYIGYNSKTYTVQVSGVNADAGPSSMCSGGTVQLGGNPSASGGAPPYSYNWTPSVLLVNPTDSNPFATALDTTYYLSITDNNGCSNVDSIVVYSGALFADAGGLSSACNNSTFQLGGSPIAFGGTPPYTSSWFPSNLVSNATIPNPIGLQCDTTFILTVTDANGCTSADTLWISCQSLIAACGADQTLCSGGVIQIGGNPTATGTGPFTYNWSPSQYLSSATDPNPFAINSDTTYVLTVTDGLGCTSIDSIILISTHPTASASVSAAPCSAGTIQIGGSPTATGGAGSYTYLWQPSIGLNSTISSNPITTLCDTTYYLTVTDANGCIDLDTVYVFCSPTSLNVDAGADDTICMGGTFLLNPSVNGGVAPYVYNWQPANLVSDPTIPNPFITTCDTTYVLIVTDDNGCVNLDSIYIECHDAPQACTANDTCVSPGSPVLIGCGLSATPNYSYTWVPSIYLNSNSIINPVSTPGDTITYYLTVEDTNFHCIDIDSISICVVPPDSVWPGDANFDGLADIVDVLNIGLAYSSNGPLRTAANTNWVSQAAGNWNSSFQNGLNIKHADCDGNGIIETADFGVILQNYGLTHNKTDDFSQTSEVDPELFFDWPSTDTLGESQSVIIPIHLGTSAIPVDSIYGIAFTLYYDNQLIDTNNMSLTFSNSWIGTVSNKTEIDTNLRSLGQIDIGITRLDQQNISGFGEIATLEIVTADDLSGISPYLFDTLKLKLQIHDAVSNTGDPINIIPTEKDLIIANVKGFENVQNSIYNIKVSPNPNNGEMTISSNKTVVDYTVLSSIGESLIHSKVNGASSILLEMDQLSSGIYFLKLNFRDGFMKTISFEILY